MRVNSTTFQKRGIKKKKRKKGKETCRETFYRERMRIFKNNNLERDMRQTRFMRVPSMMEQSFILHIN